MPPVIEVDHVTKQFQLGQITSFSTTLKNGFNRVMGRPVVERAPFKALDDVSFKVEQGEVLGIIGHNGAGKSTMLKILAGISQPSQGKVTVRGRVAPLIEVGAGLVPDMTGRENIFLNASILGMKRAEIKRKFDEIVAFSELEEFIDTPVKRYSSGMQVRLGFAIATSVAAEILIVDEVLAVGDLAFQRKCFDRMESLIKREGRTVLLVSHNLRQVQRLCSRALLLGHGRVKFDGVTKDATSAYFEAADRAIALQQTSTAAKSQRLSMCSEIDALSVEVAASAVATDGTARIKYRDRLTLKLRLNLNAPLVNSVISVGIHTTDLLYLTANSSDRSSLGAELRVGVNEIICEFPDFPLSPGVYGVRVSIVAGIVAAESFYAENLVNFSIDTGDFPRISHGGECFLIPEAIWGLSSKSLPEVGELASESVA